MALKKWSGRDMASRSKNIHRQTPLTQREVGLVLNRLRIVGRNLTESDNSIDAIGRAVSNILHRGVPGSVDGIREMLRQWIAQPDIQTVVPAMLPGFKALKPTDWRARIDPRRLTDELPSRVANERVWPDGRRAPA